MEDKKMPNSNSRRGRSIQNRTQNYRNNNYNGINGQNNNYITITPPHNNLPFFAYGIFKPGELAYSRIKEYVREKYPKEIPYEMSFRDGVPLILPRGHKNFITKGFLIYFDQGREQQAYNIISKTEPEALNKWENILVGGDEANVLMGKDVDKGCSPQMEYIAEYKGKNDPFFKEAIILIEKNLNKILKKEKKYHPNVNDFFTLEMNYMLLWSAIERYSSLKYPYQSKGDNNKDFSKEESFRIALKKYVHRKDTVYNAEKLYSRTLEVKDHMNPTDYEECIKYYYTVRSNVVHRGKMINMTDYNRLKFSLCELLKIFQDVLKDTFKE